MNRLTEEARPLDTFHMCQLCGHTSSDICEFRMHYECDDQDRPEKDKIIVACRRPQCWEKIEKHPRLYVEVAWGRGEPGHFIFTCGSCKFREGARCTHPNLKANGGEGLQVIVNPILGRLCMVNGSSQTLGGQAFECKGFETKVPTPDGSNPAV